MSSALNCVFLLQAHVNISKLLLAIYVQLSYSSLVFLFLLFLGETVSDFSLFEGLLSSESVQVSLSVLHTFHLFSLSLDLFFFLSVDTDPLSNLVLLALNDSPLMLSYLVIKLPLSVLGGHLLLLLLLISNDDFLVHYPKSLLASFCSLHVFFLIPLDVEQELLLLLLQRLGLFLADLFTCGNLVDNYLSATFASQSSSFLSIHLGLNSLETLNLHHHVKSLLLSQVMIFELFVFLKLLVSDCVDF